MATNVFECEVCNEDYNFGDRKPLSLLCGHTFCHRCLMSVWTTGNKSCPRCRRAIQQAIDTLPVIYALIPATKNPISETETETHHSSAVDRCPSHGCALDYFCVDCEDIVCRKCSKQTHALHNVEFVDDVVERDEISTKFTSELNGILQAEIDRLKTSISLSNQISQSVISLTVGDGSWQYHKDLFLAQKDSITKDLEAWQDPAPKSIEEKHKIFKTLCQYWRERKRTFSETELSILCTKLDQLSVAAQLVQTATQQLKSHLQPPAVYTENGIHFSTPVDGIHPFGMNVVRNRGFF